MAKKQRKGREKRPTGMAGLAPAGLDAIEHFVVLMLENRSFDHALGAPSRSNASLIGLSGSEFNYADPAGLVNKVTVGRATATAVGFDPAHEFEQVRDQLYGPGGGDTPATDTVPMSGFVSSSRAAGGGSAKQVMEYLEADQMPVFTKLAEEFAVFNFWYSPMPGPTWPNRFFVHAGTSGGLSESPSNFAILRGFGFENGTIYDRLSKMGKGWRIYHEDMPQAIGIKSMLSKYVQKGKYFREMEDFADDVARQDLPAFTFIEPRYDAFNDFANGNSMHPHNDVGHGEQLIKDVYEAIRKSTLWSKTMLIVTFDEHGGFYDHIPPPRALPTGDDDKYASTPPFPFDRYGVRVPTVVVSAFTERNTVVGVDRDDPKTIFDHCSVVATVRKRYGFQPLSKREAKANTLDVAINRAAARDSDAPRKLPAAKVPPKAPVPFPESPPLGMAAAATKPLTKDQETFLALAQAVDREMNPEKAATLAATAAAPVKPSPAQAAAYAARVQAEALKRRKAPTVRGNPKPKRAVTRKLSKKKGRRKVKA